MQYGKLKMSVTDAMSSLGNARSVRLIFESNLYFPQRFGMFIDTDDNQDKPTIKSRMLLPLTDKLFIDFIGFVTIAAIAIWLK